MQNGAIRTMQDALRAQAAYEASFGRLAAQKRQESNGGWGYALLGVAAAFIVSAARRRQPDPKDTPTRPVVPPK
jgi:hypothetical protein